jgi:hypothetical protein
METDHNVYVLGAGFSADAGLPLVSDFLNRLRDSAAWLKSQKRLKELDSVKKVLQFRLDAAAAAYRAQVDVENIEELFSLAAASESETMTDDVISAIAATLDYCHATKRHPRDVVLCVEPPREPLPHWTKSHARRAAHNVPRYDFYMGLINGRLCEQAESRSNTIITFNYDLVVEESLRLIDVPFSYTLPSEVAIDDTARSTGITGETDALRLLKLHGSVNWGYPDTRDEGLTIFGDYASARRGAKYLQIVPPTWKKNFGAELSKVWEMAVAALRDATRIVMIGFSIPEGDAHFKYLLAAGLRQNISLSSVTRRSGL